MTDTPDCPKCSSAYTYEDGIFFICPVCAHEWTLKEDNTGSTVKSVTDANGTVLQNGDTVIVIKDLKVKGTSATVKIGTKVKSIRIVEGDHDLDCKIPRLGQIKLKSAFVKKV